jgi:hypothetical protein
MERMMISLKRREKVRENDVKGRGKKYRGRRGGR